MSRYTDAFESNVSGTFTVLKAIVDEMELGDVSQTNTVIEIKRLKKITTYINDVLNSIDPELVPLNLWELFPQYSQGAIEQIGSYNKSLNIVYIQHANNSLDSLLNLIRPYMVLKTKTKSIFENVFVNTTKDLEKFITKLHSEASDVQAQLNEILFTAESQGNKIIATNSEIQSVKSNLLGDGDTQKGLINIIKARISDLEEMGQEIADLHQKLIIGKDKELSTEESILVLVSEIKTKRDEIQQLNLTVENEVSELKDFYIKIFGKSHDDNNLPVAGLSYEITERLKELRTLESSNKRRYEELLKQIETLLPGATSAGLATAYRQMKRSYEKPIITFNRLFYWAIGFLVLTSLFTIMDISYGKEAGLIINSKSLSTWDLVIKAMINKLPLFGALIWFAFFVSKRRSEAQRLQQEYAHKEALAKSYASYKKQIEAIDPEDKGLQKEFITKMVDAIAFNASQTLDGNHGDKHPLQSALEKITDKLQDNISVAELADLFKRK